MPRKSKYKTVTVFESFVAAAETLGDDAEKGRLYSAIMRYSLYGEEPTLDGIAAAFFELMKPNIDKSNCRRNARINVTNEEQTGNKNGTNEEPCSGFALPKEEDEEEEEEGEWLLAADILQRVQKASKMKFSSGQVNYFGRILQRLEVKSFRKTRGVYYHVVPVE